MSAVSLSRFRVTCVDDMLCDIIVEAVSEAAAIKKARRIYHLNGMGEETLGYSAGEVAGWRAVALVPEVVR